MAGFWSVRKMRSYLAIQEAARRTCCRLSRRNWSARGTGCSSPAKSNHKDAERIAASARQIARGIRRWATAGQSRPPAENIARWRVSGACGKCARIWQSRKRQDAHVAGCRAGTGPQGAPDALHQLNRTTKMLRESRLPLDKSLEAFDVGRLPAKAARQLRTLLDGGFLERAENALVFGNPGSGKTHMLQAVAQELVRKGHRMLFTS